jgi:phosphatidylethanolamine/phosphatidyl-N-methylethanolamine N-methyltransferase
MAKRLIAALNDTRFFVVEWLANPQRTGAVAPSSPKLTEAMARWLPASRDSHVLELGPGTGAVTTALLKQGLRQERLVAIENNPKMAEVLRERFPRATIITGDAWHLDRLLEEHGITEVGAVFSSLPLMNFPEQEAEVLAGKIRAVLQPRGRLVQYSYHIGRLRTRGGSQFRMIASHIVWFNFPPARVSVFQK